MNPIIETFFLKSQNAELANLVAAHWGYEFKSDLFYHIAYIQTEESKHLIYSGGNSEVKMDVVKPKVNLSDRIRQLKNPDSDTIGYILATYEWPEFDYLKINERFETISNPIIRDILQRTNGYLLYKCQLSALYKILTGADEESAIQWARSWNVKKHTVRNEAKELFIGEFTLFDYITSNPAPFVIREPLNEAKSVLKYCF